MNMRTRKRNVVIIAVLSLLLVCFLGYNYLYQDHRDIQTEEAITKVAANELQEIFSKQPSHEYLNKTIIVTGIISEKDDSQIILNGKVQCALLETTSDLKLGSLVNIKGRCLGYDELFEIVKLDQCSLQTSEL